VYNEGKKHMETNFFAQLSAIRARREERDEWLVSQILIPVSKNLKESFFRWVDGELNDLKGEIGLLDTIVVAMHSGISARERITKSRTELSNIETKALQEALDRLQQLIDYIEEESEKTPKDVIEKFKKNVEPALGIVSRLSSIRQTLDSMADMIPQPSIESE
jgi:hypothetical protein